MEQYIPKSALVAELKKKIRDYWSDSENTMGIYPYALEEVIKYVDTLEVKEVNLEKEIQVFSKMELELIKIYDANVGLTITMHQLCQCAKHFFELSLNTHK